MVGSVLVRCRRHGAARCDSEIYPEHLTEFEVALMAGMRQSEQFTRDWSDIDLDAGTIRLQISKNGEWRFVRLNTRALASLKMLHAQSIGSGRVFPNLKPRWFTKAVREAKIQDFTRHEHVCQPSRNGRCGYPNRAGIDGPQVDSYDDALCTLEPAASHRGSRNCARQLPPGSLRPKIRWQ